MITPYSGITAMRRGAPARPYRSSSMEASWMVVFKAFMLVFTFMMAGLRQPGHYTSNTRPYLPHPTERTIIGTGGLRVAGAGIEV